jgi:hypothetical protein
LQTVLSSHAVPLATFVWLTPVVALHASVVHGLLSFVTSGVPATHVPVALHVSWPLQTVLSSHAVPLATFVWLTPVVALHASVVHGLLSFVTRAVPATHVPVALHVSWPLQTVLSSHAVPLATFVWLTPVVALHASVVHGLLSSTTSGVPAAHVPAALHVSWPLQTVLSSHAVPFGLRAGQTPVVLSQVPVL